MFNIKSFKYFFSDDQIGIITNKITKILSQQDFLTMGKYCSELEKNFSQYNQSPHVLTTSSGTSALELVLSSINIKNCEVLLPSNSFVATASAIVRSGGKPIYVDCDHDLNLCFEDLKLKATSGTKVVIIVHIGGYISPKIQKIQTWCKENNFLLVEDAAHAIGSTAFNTNAGNFGDAAAFSLFTTKVLTSGEGGLVTTRHRDLYEKMCILRNHGQETDNIVPFQGSNWRMHEFNAILALEQLKSLNENITNRKNIALIYDQYVNQLSQFGVNRIQLSQESQSNLYKYIILLPNSNLINDLTVNLKTKYNIASAGRVYPIPIHQQKGYEEKVNLPNTERYCKEHFCLPLYMTMTTEEAHYTGQALLNEVKLLLSPKQ